MTDHAYALLLDKIYKIFSIVDCIKLAIQCVEHFM